MGCQFHAGSTGDGGGERDAQDDAPVDADTTPPAVTMYADAHATNMATLSYQLDIPASRDRLLLVSAQTGNTCSQLAPATIDSITYGGMALAPVETILGVQNCATDTRTEVWALVAPPTGTAMVVVTLSAAEPTLHSIAVAFEGVDPTTPVGDRESASGAADAASVTVASSPYELVVSFVGQGSGINRPTTGTPIVIDNVSSGSSLDNSGASTVPGAASVAASWVFGSSDNFQEVALSLRP